MSSFAKRAARAVIPGSLWSTARAVRLHRAVDRYQRRVVEHSYGGHRLRVLLADQLGEGWYDHDWSEPPELHAFRGRSLRPGARVFDIGAHQAVVALMLEREVRPGGSVVAVELNGHNASVARENVLLNAPASVVVVPAAVSDCVGTAKAEWQLNASLTEARGEQVQTVTIDELARQHGPPDLVYVDIEGHEVRALRGAAETLAGNGDFFVEVHAYGALQAAGGSVDELLSLLKGRMLLAMLEGDERFAPLPATLPRERFFVAALAARR